MPAKFDNNELIAYLRSIFGQKTDSFLSCPPEKPAVRANTLKCSPALLRHKMDEWGVRYRPLFFNPAGFAIEQTPLPLSHTLEFFRGYFQIQGIASQLPALALAPKPGERVLDMAAAPGSKSTQMAALMENRGVLYLNDINRGRLQALNANTQRAGAMNTVVTCLPGERFGNLFPAFFDKILLDAPCTALGTLPGHPEVAGWWSLQKLEKLSALQYRLLISAVKALKVGGELVYSTCSLAPQENEQVIQKILDNYPLDILAIETLPAGRFAGGWAGFSGTTFSAKMPLALRTDPLEHGMEGFFVVRLKKTAATFENPPEKRMAMSATHAAQSEIVGNDLAELSARWGIDEAFWRNFRFIRTKTRLWMVNRDVKEVPQTDFVSAGLLLAEKRISGWRLTNQSAQLLNTEINKRRVNLPDEDFIRLFAEGTVITPGLNNGYYALERRGDVLAILYVENGAAKIRLPHRFRLESVTG